MLDPSRDVAELQRRVKALQDHLELERQTSDRVRSTVSKQKLEIVELKLQMDRAKYAGGALALVAIILGVSFTNISSKISDAKEQVNIAKSLSEDNKITLARN